MPQLPTSTAEEYGAEDEIMRFNQEEDECSDTSTVDVVNDIKDDLLNEDGPDSGKSEDDHLYRNHTTTGRYGKDTNPGGMYGSPAAVIVGPHRYYDHPSSYRTSSNNNLPSHPHSESYAPGTQIRVPTYQRDDRAFYEHGPWPPTQVGIPPHYSSMHYGSRIPSNFRYPQGIPPAVAYYGPGHGYPMPGRPTKEQKRPHVKKPLNAFMLFMKEQRPKIAAEFTLKESAAINQILGKRWHALDKSEQAKYYEMARKERAIHMQLYPGWSARDNYAQLGRKKKRPRDKNEEMNPKKCRARYGLDKQEQWCKPCRRKKKCIRFLIGADGQTTEIKDGTENSDSDDNNEHKSKHFDSKEHLQHLVSMTTTAVTTEKQLQSSNINISTSKHHRRNNNNVSNVCSSSSTYVATENTAQSASSALNAISGISLPSSTLASTAVTQHRLYSSTNSILGDKTMDSSQLKTISASCS